MKLYTLNNIIKEIALSQPNVREYNYGDVYESMNQSRTIEYAAMVLTHQNSEVVDEYTRNHTFNLFYIDRMLQDESNKLEIQSQGQEVIENIISNLDGAGIYILDNRIYTNFIQKFADLCAGVYLTFTAQVPNEDCEGEEIRLVNSVNGQSGDVFIDLSGGFRIISAKARLQGDVNDDGFISIADNTALSNRIRTGEGEWPESNYDVNLDGQVSIADLTLESNLILGRGERPLIVFDENPYMAIVSAFEDGKVPVVKAMVGSKVYPMIVYKASSGMLNNDYTTYLSSAIYNDELIMKVEYKEDSTYGVLSSNDIDLSDYYTKEETDAAIESAVTSGADLSDYWTSAQTENAIIEATSGITSLPSVTSADNGKILMVVNGAWALVTPSDPPEPPTPPTPTDYSKKYFTLKGATSFGFIGSSNVFEYSTDSGTTWAEVSGTTDSTHTDLVEVNEQETWLRCTNPTIDAMGIGNLYIISGNTTVEGNIMSLVYGDDFESATTINAKQFYQLFYRCNTLVDAEHLILPATTLANQCYSNMFNGCTSLTSVPELPATTLANQCYYSMFQGCTSLITAPELPATTLADGCYFSMFYLCTSLTTAPELRATELAISCYKNMFQDCTSLRIAPILPATTLSDSCYYGMFQGCTTLYNAPELPSTTLANYCYDNMFFACSSLTTAPELPSTTLANYCYQGMFVNCSGLTTAPELLASALKEGCYQTMFQGCTNLNYIKMLATNTSARYCLGGWVRNVAANGTFVKAASITTLPTGNSGIPNGWTVVDAT